MPQSDMIQALLELQKDLNSITISSMRSSSCTADLIQLYVGTEVGGAPLRVKHFTTALNNLVNAMNRTINDIDEIARLIDDKG